MTFIQDLTIEAWPLERLVPYEGNARVHSASQIAQIAFSIKEYGFTNPILAGPDGEIIAGHGRVLAARKLGLTQVPVIVLRHLSETQKRALRLADNQLALNARWDPELVRLELEALVEQNVNLDSLGFSDQELQELLAQEIPLRGSDPDFIPELWTEPVSRPGDLWVLGEHRLLCGDGTHGDSLEHVLAGRPCAMVWTDLPYNVSYSGKGPGRMKIANDDLGAQFGDFLRLACHAMLSVAQGTIYICMSSSELHNLHRAFVDAGGHWSTYVLWVKNTFTLGRSDYQRQYEPMLYGWRRGATHHWCGDRNQSDVWFVDKPLRNPLHPTMKPVQLVERAVQNSSRPGNVVLDPFAGAGATMIACENLKRQACLVEIDPQYVDVSIRRWQKYTGQRARLDGEAKYFDEIKQERRIALPNHGDAI